MDLETLETEITQSVAILRMTAIALCNEEQTNQHGLAIDAAIDKLDKCRLALLDELYENI